MSNVVVTKQALMEQAQKAVSIDAINKEIEGIIDLVVRKNHDYGDAWQRYGIFTPLIRINDKTLRLATLNNSQALVADENVADTLRDTVGYALLALLWLDKNELHEAFSYGNAIAGLRGIMTDYQSAVEDLYATGIEPDSEDGKILPE